LRFPKLSELDKDQTQIYQGAPMEGSILVLGPPGTGKTVIAFHRADTLSRKNQKPRVIMFNNVLSRYTSGRDDVAVDVEVSTMHSWAYKWWGKMTGSWKAGVPNKGKKFDYDWLAVQQKCIKKIVDTPEFANKVNWGHIIVDEGQDFSAQMYSTLNIIMTMANAKGVTPPMAISVYADENQRLNSEQNSTIKEIRTSLGLSKSDNNVFYLKKNYRNTIQIAKFASNFYVGLSTGMPDLPTKKGRLPMISIASNDTKEENLKAFCKKISRYAKINDGMEIGVLVPNNSIRVKIINYLNKDLSEGVVQSFPSSDKSVSAGSAAKELIFDTPGHVSVLNFKSAKGLEFDAVFVIDPGNIYQQNSVELEVKMTLYVMCSRAREFLNIMLVRNDSADAILKWIPSQANNEKEEL
jgi:DNA helicase II / ATP-dependent DNA helicase PcrA